uniref:Putative secreted protein n=1 Tax=Ixodes ricinus TaxID=34613 RepID=A0A6B0UG25_IXORI
MAVFRATPATLLPLPCLAVPPKQEADRRRIKKAVLFWEKNENVKRRSVTMSSSTQYDISVSTNVMSFICCTYRSRYAMQPRDSKTGLDPAGSPYHER